MDRTAERRAPGPDSAMRHDRRRDDGRDHHRTRDTLGRRHLRRRSAFVAVLLTFGGMGLTGCQLPWDPPPPPPPPTSGCGTTTQTKVVDQDTTLVVGSDTRNYKFTVPSVHTAHTTKPIPLVLDLHGLIEGTVGTHALLTQFSPKAEKEGFAVAYPVGNFSGLAWDTSIGSGNKDLAFIDALISHFESTMCIDTKRIYVTGFSYGAFMTSSLMCMRSTVFAAAAPVAGIQNNCGTPTRKIPVLSDHGTADPILSFNSYKDTPQAWATKYGCGGPTRSTVVANDPKTNGPIYHDVWNCGLQGTAVEFYTITGGGHAWPGSAFSDLIGVIVGPTASSINATDITWDFFKRFSLP